MPATYHRSRRPLGVRLPRDFLCRRFPGVLHSGPLWLQSSARSCPYLLLAGIAGRRSDQGTPATEALAGSPRPGSGRALPHTSAWAYRTWSHWQSSSRRSQRSMSGLTNIETSAQVVEALEPVTGSFTFTIFAVGVGGTGLLSVPVRAGSAAYALGQAQRWPVGLDRRPTQAKAFYATIAGADHAGNGAQFLAHQSHQGPLLECCHQRCGGGASDGVMTVMPGDCKVTGTFTVRIAADDQLGRNGRHSCICLRREWYASGREAMLRRERRRTRGNADLDLQCPPRAAPQSEANQQSLEHAVLHSTDKWENSAADPAALISLKHSVMARLDATVKGLSEVFPLRSFPYPSSFN